MTFNKKPNDPDIWNKKPVTSDKTHDLSTDEIIVPTQQMFPNCEKYHTLYGKCCDESGAEEMYEMAEKMYDEPINPIKPNKANRINIIKKIKPVKENPFPDGDNW